MFCHHCGEKLCSSSGKALKEVSDKDIKEANKREKKTSSKATQTAMLLIPVLTLLLTGGGVYGYYMCNPGTNPTQLFPHHCHFNDC
ncbi:hypothetical protein ACQKFO_14670 [Rossellomorea sp. NPDC071047]|uniref:hypothetical protein n=1 Tax=Rossellomorea sp. NPDC071047 TaxID=3390675 RepID=UPI003D00A3DE